VSCYPSLTLADSFVVAAVVANPVVVVVVVVVACPAVVVVVVIIGSDLRAGESNRKSVTTYERGA
jgi:NADH:ubiquinone oxidoreductase subunit 3 (subunit A)